MTRWEYLVDHVFFGESEGDGYLWRDYGEDIMNQRGEEGWELVNVLYEPETSSFKSIRMYFYKRLKEPEKEKAPAIEI